MEKQTQIQYQKKTSNIESQHEEPYTQQPQPQQTLQSFIDIYDHNLHREIQKLSLQKYHPHLQLFVNLYEPEHILLKALQMVSFPNLIKIQITNWISLQSLQTFAFIDAPMLEQLKVSDCSRISSFSPLKKLHSDTINILRLQNPSPTCDLTALHRLKFWGLSCFVSVMNLKGDPNFISIDMTFLMKLQFLIEQNMFEPFENSSVFKNQLKSYFTQKKGSFGTKWDHMGSIEWVQMSIFLKKLSLA